MATFPRKGILGIFFIIAVYCNCQSYSSGASSSWAKLQISPDTLSSMEYGNFLIEIYEHTNNHKATTTNSTEKKYFYSPIALLDHKSAVSRYNRVTKQPEMRFRVEMWNDKIQNEVVKHLNEIVGHEIKSNKVRVIPLEKVILTSNTPTEGYSLSPMWTNYDKSKTLRLYLSCYDQQICDELADEMRSDPEQFHHLKLLYSLSSQTSQTKQTTISIDSVTSGQMFTNLLQQFGDKKEVFLTANDEKKMLAETVTNIRLETFDDSEVGSPDTENQIYNILKDLMIMSRTNIKEQSDKMWDSVFWNEENYRPDKTTKTLNEIIKKLDKETQKKLVDMFQKAEKQSEIIENLISNNKYGEKRGEEQLRREKQTKDENEIEMGRSEATDQEQFNRNQIRDDKSTTNKDNTDVNIRGLFGIDGGVKKAGDNSHTHNFDQQNENWDLAKTNFDEHNRNVENKERIQHNYDSNSWAEVDRISSFISEKIANESDSSRQVKTLKENVEKLLQESREHVQWDGEKFVPKPMQLSRIILAKFRDSQSFQDRSVRVRYTNAELSAPIKFMEHTELTVTDEWNNLKDELKYTRDLLVKTSTELTNTGIDLTKKLKETKEQLEKSKADLSKSVDALSTKFNEDLGETRRDLTNMRTYLTQNLNATEKELAEMKIIDGNLSTEVSELKANSKRLSHELNVAEEKLKKELSATLNHLETATTNLNTTRTELSSTNAIVADWTTQFNGTKKELEVIKTNLDSIRIELVKTKSTIYDLSSKLNARTSEMVDINQMPTSCEDLQRIGHKLSGMFLLQGSKRIETVYCNFNSNEKQKWIGYANLKSAPVHFYVQRNDSFSPLYTPILFKSAQVNEGYAMNLTSGKFTAPRAGIYFFSFKGSLHNSISNWSFQVLLYMNGDIIEGSTSRSAGQHPWAIQTTLYLNSGDQIWGQIEVPGQKVNPWHPADVWPRPGHVFGCYVTHFTGSLLEEEIL